MTWYSVGAVGFVLTRPVPRGSDGPDSTKVRPTPAGSRATRVWVTDHDRCQLAAVQYTALQ